MFGRISRETIRFGLFLVCRVFLLIQSLLVINMLRFSTLPLFSFSKCAAEVSPHYMSGNLFLSSKLSKLLPYNGSHPAIMIFFISVVLNCISYFFLCWITILDNYNSWKESFILDQTLQRFQSLVSQFQWQMGLARKACSYHDIQAVKREGRSWKGGWILAKHTPSHLLIGWPFLTANLL